ncbi:EAL and HDOD domain-containing protein [Zooshikella sp. RANM57]|uniref:EAL and HDOD domain-containing protein n=1 Tax=Zooshikella sp. RANM57 TaxID=3425863 RepID=UPI003D6EF6C0
MAEKTILLARQPIFDTQKKVKAYELLFRDQNDHQAIFEDGNAATSNLLDSVIGSLQLEDVIGDVPAFVNFTHQLLFNPPVIDKNRFVIEVLEDIIFDEQTVAAVKKLHDDGFTIALDDYQHSEDKPSVLPYVDIVKIDVLDTPKEEIPQILTELKAYNVKTLAEKVETYGMLSFCREAGFDLFQGYFLCKPEQVHGHRLESNKAIVMQLLAKLQNPDVEVSELESIIDKDPTIAIKILRLVNSAYYRRTRTVESIKQAITMLGITQIRNLVIMLKLSTLVDKPNELIVLALQRALMCQLMSRHIKGSDPSQYFLVGLLSMLDAFFDQTLESVLSSLALPDEHIDAALHYKGIMGFILSTTILYEQAAWQKINWGRLLQLNISDFTVRDAYLASLSAAHQLQKL